MGFDLFDDPLDYFIFEETTREKGDKDDLFGDDFDDEDDEDDEDEDD